MYRGTDNVCVVLKNKDNRSTLQDGIHISNKLWWLEKLNVKQVLVGALRSAEKPYAMFAFVAESAFTDVDENK